MDDNQRTTKIKSQDVFRQTQKSEDCIESKTGMSGTQSSLVSKALNAGADVRFVNAEFLRRQYGTVAAGPKGPAFAGSPVSAHMKVPKGLNVYQTSTAGQVMTLNVEKEQTPSPVGDTPPTTSHTTKSSSLSRDISPSRITAQVVSIMSESSQPLLLSALTGKMSAPMMLSTRSDHLQNLKRTHGDAASIQSSPDHRHSPVLTDSRPIADSKEPKMHTKPFESLMRAAALAKAHDLHARSSVTQLGGQHLGIAASSGTQQRGKQTPLPAARSPHHSRQQGQPVVSVSRSSPAQCAGQEVYASNVSMSGGVLIPVTHMGLVTQHLLAGTITTTATTSGAHFRHGSTVSACSVQPNTVHSKQVVEESNVKLSSLPIDMSSRAMSQKGKGSRTLHVACVGTGTECKQYASQGAQTKEVANISEKQDKRFSFQSQRQEEELQKQDAGNVHKAEKILNKGGFLTTSAAVGINRLSPVNPVVTVGHSSNRSLSCLNAVSVSRAVAFPPSSVESAVGVSSTTGDVNSCQAHMVLEHTGHNPLPTPAHLNKPISVLSSHSHAHSHTQQPSPHSGSQVPVSLATVLPSTVSHVSTAPVSQPLVSLSCMPISSTHVQPVKQEVKTAAVTVPASSLAMSTNYQPHHHHYHSLPAHTITSQTLEPGPVVKDYFPVTTSQNHPLHHRPLPPHINPFTFPTSGIKLYFPSAESATYTNGSKLENTERTVSANDSAVSRPYQQYGAISDQLDNMPNLTPENVEPSKAEIPRQHGAFNHVGHIKAEGKEQMMSPFNMRLQNLSNFPSMASAYRTTYRSHSVALQRAKAGSITSAAKSLDLLRQNIQKNINKDMQGIIQKYIEKFFKPAADNIRLNNGANSVSEEHINAVCRQIFEEAKRMYTTETRRCATPIVDFSDNISESGSLNGRRVSPIPLLKRLKASDSDSEKGSENGAPKRIPRRKGRPPLNNSGRTTPVKPPPKEGNVRREGPKWDPDRIQADTLFVMGARANKALGLGNTRGRLYIRHPDVFKYSGDQEDKIWLHEQKLMPATGGKAYMLLVEDITDLSKSEEYRDSPTLLMHECRGFQVPDWMIIKIRAQMQSQRSDLMKRSRSRSPLSDQLEPPRTLPFSNFSDTASNNDIDSIGNKNSLQPSPDTEENEFLSAVENEDTQPSDASPFNVTGGFDDTASQSLPSLDPGSDDAPLATPFT